MRHIIILSFLFLLISGCNNNEGDHEWTFLVYIAGDNDLSSPALSDLAEMEAIGSSDKVRIIVEIDRTTDTTKRLLVNKGGSILLDDLGELNMADPDTITDFISWAGDNFQSRHYALILWDHGNGYSKPSVFNSYNKSLHSILQDDTDNTGCCISNLIVSDAIEKSGLRIDILGLDASQMGQIETAYEFRNVADILVFSQETGEANGWDYEKILGELVKQPATSPEGLAALMVKAYRDFYEEIFYHDNPDFEQYLTISAVRLGHSIEESVRDIDRLSRALKRAIDDNKTGNDIIDSVTDVRENVQKLTPFTSPYIYVDLFDLVEKLLNQSIQIKEIDDILMELQSLKDELIISEYHGNARPNANGISIVFFKLPEAIEYRTFDSDYHNYDPDNKTGRQIAFINDTSWDEFLTDYYLSAGYFTPDQS
ncbi:MAG: clostripain-related cysteine peptidase [Nitrospirota bacterium]